jgi:hypothetical protein
LVDETPPNAVSGKWVLVGFLVLLACVGAGIVFIVNDLDRRTRNARELEQKLGRQVGPEDSPQEQKKLKAAQ